MGKYKSILIVEDDDDIREAMEMIIEAEGFQPILARNGKEALDLLKNGGCSEPCLILLDLMMPEMNGWQFMELRRKADVVASIPVIILSAVSSNGLPEGAKKLLKKPIELESLIRDLYNYCGTEEEKDPILPALNDNESEGSPLEKTG